MSEVPIWRLEIAGESRYSAAEVPGTFWPHIICCDTGQDNACTWSIWQDTGQTHSLSRCRLTDLSLSKETEQAAALQKDCFVCASPSRGAPHLSLKLSYTWKLKAVYDQNQFQFIFLTSSNLPASQALNNKLLPDILFRFLTHDYSCSLQLFIRFHTLDKIQATQADWIIPFKRWME